MTQTAQQAKTRAIDACRKTFIYGSRLMEALYVLAGEEFHAARLRPPVGSRAGVDEPADPFPIPDPGDGEGEAPGAAVLAAPVSCIRGPVEPRSS